MTQVVEVSRRGAARSIMVDDEEVNELHRNIMQALHDFELLHQEWAARHCPKQKTLSTDECTRCVAGEPGHYPAAYRRRADEVMVRFRQLMARLYRMLRGASGTP